MRKRYRARFRLLMILHVVMLVATALLLAWSVMSTEFTAVPIVIGLVVVAQLFGLTGFVESHVATLEEFFAAVNYEDLTRRFVEEDVDAELKQAFNHVIERFQNARAERDVQAGYLETVVRHVPVPFIAARVDGSLTLVNNPARRLTGLSTLTHIDQLAEVDPELPGLIREIEPGERKLLQSKIRHVPVELRVSVSEIRMHAGVERLYSIENLSGELTARESSAWRNLIRVLTHEIMNTLTPVTSLAQTVTGMLDDKSAKEEIRDAVQTIARRSEGLMNFVLRYRELLRVPQPDPTNISVGDTLRSVVTLMGKELDTVDIDFDVVPETLEVTADSSLLDQVLVNLVRNALDATREQESRRLRLSGRLDFGRVIISVQDNGRGIDDETIEQVFVPFFTTKRDGSGIGLSVSRQIMTAHGGEIALHSGPDGTTAILVF